MNGNTETICFHDVITDALWNDLGEELSLSRRHTEIIRCIFLSMPDKQIASELGIAVPTVRTYLGRIYIKFDIQDRVELIMFILDKFFAECQRNGCPRFQ